MGPIEFVGATNASSVRAKVWVSADSHDGRRWTNSTTASGECLDWFEVRDAWIALHPTGPRQTGWLTGEGVALTMITRSA